VIIVVWDKGTKIHISLLIVVVLVFIWSVIKPREFFTWMEEVSPAVVIVIIVIAIYNKFRLTTLSYFIIALLSILAFIGGHYTYAEVPLFNWIKDEFHLSRNHYDRFGHFLKGFSVIVVRELLIRKTPLTKGSWLFGIATSIVLAIAALYEIIEWLSTKLPNGGKEKKDFLGMQGDKWDAQWDMSFALIGSILAYLIFSKLHDKLLKRLLRAEK
jgi:putative membrane protein